MQRKKTSNINLKMLFFAHFIKTTAQIPVMNPIIKGNRIVPTIAIGETEAPPPIPLIIEIMVKKTITPIISSIAARGIKVLVTGPFV